MDIHKTIENITKNYVETLSREINNEEYNININITPPNNKEVKTTAYLKKELVEEMLKKEKVFDNTFVQFRTLDGNAYNYRGKLATT